MKTTFTEMQKNYEASADALLRHRASLREHLKQVRRKGNYESAMEETLLKRRIDLLTTEYGELCCALRSIRIYAEQEVRQA